MNALPTGTVAFLMSDIEGSTRLVASLGDAFPKLLDEHFALAGAAIDARGGTIVSTEGDSVFAVFDSSRQAVLAAVEMQRALAAHGWPDGIQLKARIGVHAGEAVLGGRDYTGIDVHRTARIMGAGYGGQILVSDAARALIGEASDAEVTFRDVGTHRLRDLPAPEHLFQAVATGLEDDFPPPRSESTSRTTNLPAPLTRFVGRERETAEVAALLAGERLVTLTGPGGTGKTRLAIEVARGSADGYPAGVWFVALDVVRDPELVIPTIAATLGVPPQPGRPIAELLAEFLAGDRCLLVLDNLEQVIESAPSIAELLGASRTVSILASSREPLSVAGERVYPVPPLAMPSEPGTPTAADIEALGAVALFVERARAARPDFRLTDENAPAVAAICRRLDGLPLALELAAARTNVLSPDAILGRLDQRLSLLASSRRDVSDRQRTLRGAIDWSHDLLEEPERAVFRRFGVFSGGATYEAIEAIVDPDGAVGVDLLDTVAALVDRSLVRSDTSGSSRFAMLETIREYAVEQLTASGEQEAMQARHAVFYRDLAEAHVAVATDPKRRELLGLLESELPNFRDAIAWSLKSGDHDVGLRLASALNDFWNLRNHLGEGRAALEKLLAASEGDGATAIRARAAVACAGLTSWQTDYARAMELAQQAITMGEAVGDTTAVAWGHASLGWSTFLFDPAGASNHFEAAVEIAREVGDETAYIASLQGLGTVRIRLGQLDAGRASAQEGFERAERIGDDYNAVFNLLVLGTADLLEGDLASAGEWFREALRRSHDTGAYVGTAVTLDSLAVLAFESGDPRRGARLAAAAERLRREVGGGVTVMVVGMQDAIARARETLPPADLEEEFAAGRALTVDEAVALALT